MQQTAQSMEGQQYHFDFKGGKPANKVESNQTITIDSTLSQLYWRTVLERL